MFKGITGRLTTRHVIMLGGAGVLLLLVAVTRFDFTGELDGIFLLRATEGALLELTDDLVLGDERELIASLSFRRFFRWYYGNGVERVRQPTLVYEWKKRLGRGYVEKLYPDGTKLLTCFSRFKDSDGKIPKGLFVGGGLPSSAQENAEVTLNETGMAYFNGVEWHHLWCNVNEALASVSAPGITLPPSQWQYLGSTVIEEGRDRIVITSRHEAAIDGVPLRIDRYVISRAETSYFILVNVIRNIGVSTVPYYYVYGDEPWVGEFGTSLGNVGWVKDRLFYYEGRVDSVKYNFAGMFDGGNPMILGGREKYTGMANFIEWLGDNRPENVYFSNRIGKYAEESERVPLYDKSNRVIFLQWGPKVISPGQSDLYILAIGMAGNDPQTGFPVKPPVTLDQKDLDLILSVR